MPFRRGWPDALRIPRQTASVRATWLTLQHHLLRARLPRRHRSWRNIFPLRSNNPMRFCFSAWGTSMNCSSMMRCRPPGASISPSPRAVSMRASPFRICPSLSDRPAGCRYQIGGLDEAPTRSFHIRYQGLRPHSVWSSSFLGSALLPERVALRRWRRLARSYLSAPLRRTPRSCIRCPALLLPQAPWEPSRIRFALPSPHILPIFEHFPRVPEAWQKIIHDCHDLCFNVAPDTFTP